MGREQLHLTDFSRATDTVQLNESLRAARASVLSHGSRVEHLPVSYTGCARRRGTSQKPNKDAAVTALDIILQFCMKIHYKKNPQPSKNPSDNRVKRKYYKEDLAQQEYMELV